MESGRIEKFRNLSQFHSLKAFNHTIEKFLAAHKEAFTKGELIAFKRLVRFSAKYPGIANAKIATLVAACNDHGELSRSTFERMLRKAKKLGILSLHHTKRQTGGRSHNIFIFNPFDVTKCSELTESKKPIQADDTNTQPMQNQTETDSFKTDKTKKTHNRIDDPDVSLDFTFTSDTVPAAFCNAVKPFYDDAMMIEKYYVRAKVAAYQFVYEKDADKVLDVAIRSFKQLALKFKKGAQIKDPLAYFFRICENQFYEIYFEELESLKSKGEEPSVYCADLIPNWLLEK